MNEPFAKDFLLFNLREASEELQTLISAAEDETRDEHEFLVRMAHVYHHLNTAWNGRFDGDFNATYEVFLEKRKMPTEISAALNGEA